MQVTLALNNGKLLTELLRKREVEDFLRSSPKWGPVLNQDEAMENGSPSPPSKPTILKRIKHMSGVAEDLACLWEEREALKRTIAKTVKTKFTVRRVYVVFQTEQVCLCGGTDARCLCRYLGMSG